MQQNTKRLSRNQVASAAGLVVALGVIAIAGCNGNDNNGGPQQPTPTSSPTPNASATPNITATPNASATPTARPTATPIGGGTIFTTISTTGTFNAATGRFTQTRGSFQKVSGRPRPGATPMPTAAPTPASGAATVVIYSGTYTLTSGQSGQFTFSAFPDSTADGVGIPSEVFRFEMNPVPVESGSATVTLQINGSGGSTGTGTIQLANGESGTITITRRTAIAARSRKAL